MRNTYLRAAGALLATTVGVTSAVAVAGAADAAPPIRISGTVVTADGTPLPNITVTVLRTDGVVAGSAATDSSGIWRVMRPADGTYTIRFDDPSGAYASEWYNDKKSLEEADLVDFNEGQRSDMGQTDLGAAAHLSGFVTGSTGAGIAGADVTAYVMKNGAWSPLLTADTQSDGRYDLGLLPGGTYTLGFHDPATNVGEYWNDRAELKDADTLQLSKAGTTTGLNAQLATPLPTPTENPSPTPTTTPSTTTTTSPTGTQPPTTAAKAVTVAVRPRIKGIAKVAKVLKVTKGTWTPTTVTRKIQWLANGKRIKGATKNKLRLTKKLAGKRISVRVVASAPGLTSLKITTKRTKQVRR
jgi:5-hydroxyisourate hydrolase-like protein (transthyretin family)